MMEIPIHEIKTSLFPKKPSVMEVLISFVFISWFMIYIETIHVYVCVSQK